MIIVFFLINSFKTEIDIRKSNMLYFLNKSLKKHQSFVKYDSKYSLTRSLLYKFILYTLKYIMYSKETFIIVYII